MDALKQEYARILQGLQIDKFNLDEDEYSGVFLPEPFDEYWAAKTKVMLVGREAGGWYTDTKPPQCTIKRAAGLGGVPVSEVVDESLGRYRNHFELQGDKVVDTSRSRFMQYYSLLARGLGLDSRALIYASLLAWDYDKRDPSNRPSTEYNEVVSVSQELLAAQIRHFSPDFIVFATGKLKAACWIIRHLFDDHLGGYQLAKENLVRGNHWEYEVRGYRREFEAAGATCYHISHPRAGSWHAQLDPLVSRIKASVASRSLE
ncbi:hypothetical protein [Halopseudomonas sp.]|uniref:hypothetical protein n=1 Tax=Halopseudomonas sp. TaxID=2901191 RepID=UPI0030013A08